MCVRVHHRHRHPRRREGECVVFFFPWICNGLPVDRWS